MSEQQLGCLKKRRTWALGTDPTWSLPALQAFLRRGSPEKRVSGLGR